MKMYDIEEKMETFCLVKFSFSNTAEKISWWVGFREFIATRLSRYDAIG